MKNEKEALHCTKRLLENYRKIKAAIERAEQRNVNKHMQPNVNLVSLESREQSVEVSKYLLKELEAAVDDLRNTVNGEIYYQIIRLCYLEGNNYMKTEDVLEALLDRRIQIKRRRYFEIKKQATKELSINLWCGLDNVFLQKLKTILYEEV